MTRRAKSTEVAAATPTFPAIPPTDVLGRLAALQTAATPDLKQQWRELFGTEPPPHNRAYLQSRLAYRIQELAYGGLKPETLKRLLALGEQLDGGNVVLRRIRGDDKPVAGTPDLVDVDFDDSGGGNFSLAVSRSSSPSSPRQRTPLPLCCPHEL